MVQLSAFPKCWIDNLCDGRMKLTEWIDTAVQLECDGLEFYTRFLDLQTEEQLREARRYTHDKGMDIPMLCHSPDFTHPDKSRREREIEEQKKAIRTTAALGGGFTRVLSGQKYPGVPVADGISVVVDCIGRCLDVAEEYKIILVMENHYKDGFWKYSEFAQRAEIFTAIINQIHSPWFGVQYDPSNSIVANENPLDLLNLVAGRVRTMHASDRYVQEGYDPREVLEQCGQIGYHPALKHGVIGRGLNDYPAIFAKLKQAGFNGWVSIEDGINGLDEMKESARFLRAMIETYFGENE
jgi:sugar phosphate isomerase/epimerase